MNKAELEQYFLAQLVDGKATLTIAKGRASYQMKRGSFKTRDHIVDRRKLPFVFQEGNRYLFSDGRVSAEIIVDRSPFIKFHFHVDTGYNRFKLTFQSFPNEHIYGCGEQYTHLDLKGQKVTIWVSEHQRISCLIKKFLREKLHGVNPDYQAPYKNHQTYYSAPCFVSSENYAFYCHEDTYGQLVFSEERDGDQIPPDSAVDFLIDRRFAARTRERTHHLDWSATSASGLGQRWGDSRHPRRERCSPEESRSGQKSRGQDRGGLVPRLVWSRRHQIRLPGFLELESR
jgi:hypothetical protein